MAGDRKPDPIPARDARGGEIILKSRWQRRIFAGGLALVVLAALAI